MRLDLPGIVGSGDLYLEIMRIICGDTQNKSMVDLMCFHAPYTPQLGFKERTYVDIQNRELDFKEENRYFFHKDVLDFIVENNSHKGWDFSICADGIEHMTKEKGYILLVGMKQISQNQIIFTPLGPYNITDDDNPDSHRSGWMPEDFPGWATIVLPDFHPQLNTGAFFAFHCDNIEQEFERVYNLLKHKQMDKIEQIKQAIEKADNLQSKMDAVAWSIPALSSLRIRHLMNNLGAISTRYYEAGVHISGLFSSVLRNNCNLLSATANDSFASDETGDIKYEPQFHANTQKCICPNTEFKMLKGDTFDFKSEDVLGPIDLYLFDANHSYEAQRQAMTHFLPAMADEFIVCVDDYDWKDVMTGTGDGLRRDADLEFLFQQEFYGNDHDNDGWWNGFYIALLKKK